MGVLLMLRGSLKDSTCPWMELFWQMLAFMNSPPHAPLVPVPDVPPFPPEELNPEEVPFAPDVPFVNVAPVVELVILP